MRKIFGLALVMVSICNQAHAQNGLHAYVSGALGLAHIKQDCSISWASCDTSETGFKLIGGFELQRNLSFEISYFDFGKASNHGSTTYSYRVNGTYRTGKATLDYDLKVSGIGAGIAYSANFSPALHGVMRAGLIAVTSKESGNNTLDGAVQDTFNSSKTNPRLYLGIGAGYQLNKQLSLDLSADFSSVKTEYVGNGGVRLFSVGTTYRF